MLAHRRAAERHRRADELVVPLLGPSAQELDLLPVLGRLDAALLLLPRVGFVEYEDERMVRTARTIREELDDDGLIKRYRTKGYEEGAFLACSFWLVDCMAHQGRLEEAGEVFDRALSTGNDLGLFSEEYDTKAGEMLGNFPQGLTHLSHITAALALTRNAGTGPSA